MYATEEIIIFIQPSSQEIFLELQRHPAETWKKMQSA